MMSGFYGIVMPPKGQAAYYQDTSALSEARAEWGQGNYRQSLRLFERAVKRDPYNLRALKEAAYAFGQHFEVATASKYIKRMERLSGHDPGALQVIFEAWNSAYRPKAAVESLEKAVLRGDARPETYLSLAQVYEKRHQLDEAAELTEQYLKASPNAPEGLRLRALLMRRQGEEDKALEWYQKFESSCPKKHQLVLAQILNEWAQLLDKQGDYEGAFDKIQKSKELLIHRSETKGLLVTGKKEMEEVDLFLATLSREHIQDWISDVSHGQPDNVILTGCPRSGTTLIEKVLDAHSEIITAEELGVFSNYIVPNMINQTHQGVFGADDLANLSDALLRRESKNYFRYMEAALDEKLRGRTLIDKVPSNTMVAPFMMRMLPKTKVLYALRDPRDILISCYFCWMPMNIVSVHFQKLSDTAGRVSQELLWWKQIRSVLPSERWCETRYEEVVVDWEREAKRLLEWLDLPWEDGLKDYRSHLQSRGVSSPTYEAVNQPVYQGAVGRWKNYEKQLEPYLEKMNECLEVYGY